MLPPQQGKQTSSHLSVGNLCSGSRKRNFLRPEIQNFPWGACPWTPLVKSASGARLSIGQAIYTSRNASMQKAGYAPGATLYSGIYVKILMEGTT